jgi:predicted permease
MITTWLRRLRSRESRMRERAEEMRAHVDLYTEDLIARGVPAGEARRQARIKFGNPRVKLEEVDALNGFAWLDALGRDFRDARRSLAASPGFTFVVLIVLTLGVGATTAIFSVVDAVVLRGLPFEESDRLAGISRIDLKNGSAQLAGFDAADAIDYRQRQDVFAALAAVPEGPMPSTLRGDPVEQVYVTRSTADLFDVLRVRPQLGRLFSAEHEIRGNHRVVLISDGLWRRRFGADPAAVGKTLVVESVSREIVGVMPAGFAWPVDGAARADVWIPWVVRDNEKSRDGGRARYISLVGRLKPGISFDQAHARIDQIRASLAVEHPAWFKDEGIRVRPLVDAIVGDSVQSWMWLLLGAVLCVLLIACANVANLLLARTAARTHELRIRSALGASRWQLVRSVQTESLLLTLAGTALAVVAVYGTVDVMRTVLPQSVPRLSSITVDLRILAAAALAAIVCGLLIGLGPAIYLTTPTLAGALRDSRPLAAGGRSRHLQTAFIVGEVALAVVLLVGSGLFVASFIRLMRVELGFDYRGVAAIALYPRIDMSNEQARNETHARAEALLTGAIERLRAIPGIESAAALSGGLPLTTSWTRYTLQTRGRDFRDDDMVDLRQATPDYPKVMRLTLVQGRWLSPADTRGAERVVVLNDVAARRYLAGEQPIGADVTFQTKTWKVVGVVKGLRLGGPESDVRPEAYISIAQSQIVGGQVVVRAVDPASLPIAALRDAVRTVNPQAAPEVEALDDLFSSLIATRRFNMLLLSMFGLLAVAIATIGVYGVMAFLVAHRTQEIAVRLALGADAPAVLRSVLSQAAVYLLGGLALGFAGAFSLAGLTEAFLFQVRPHDVGVYAATGAVLVIAGLVAAWLPARRASRVDPLVALRAG